MKIFIDENELGEKYKGLTLPEILKSVKNSLKDKILKKIYINNVEVNERYLAESLLEKDDIEIIKFATQGTTDLVKETLDEIDKYLPVLRTGVMDTADLFRNGKNKEANEKYQQVIEGIGWYIEATLNILSINGKEGIYEEGQGNLNSFNKILSDLMVAHKKNDNILLADILEYEVSEFINVFINFNKAVNNQ